MSRARGYFRDIIRGLGAPQDERRQEQAPPLFPETLYQHFQEPPWIPSPSAPVAPDPAAQLEAALRQAAPPPPEPAQPQVPTPVLPPEMQGIVAPHMQVAQQAAEMTRPPEPARTPLQRFGAGLADVLEGALTGAARGLFLPQASSVLDPVRRGLEERLATSRMDDETRRRYEELQARMPGADPDRPFGAQRPTQLSEESREAIRSTAEFIAPYVALAPVLGPMGLAAERLTTSAVGRVLPRVMANPTARAILGRAARLGAEGLAVGAARELGRVALGPDDFEITESMKNIGQEALTMAMFGGISAGVGEPLSRALSRRLPQIMEPGLLGALSRSAVLAGRGAGIGATMGVLQEAARILSDPSNFDLKRSSVEILKTAATFVLMDLAMGMPARVPRFRLSWRKGQRPEADFVPTYGDLRRQGYQEVQPGVWVRVAEGGDHATVVFDAALDEFGTIVPRFRQYAAQQQVARPGEAVPEIAAGAPAEPATPAEPAAPPRRPVPPERPPAPAEPAPPPEAPPAREAVRPEPAGPPAPPAEAAPPPVTEPVAPPPAPPVPGPVGRQPAPTVPASEAPVEVAVSEASAEPSPPVPEPKPEPLPPAKPVATGNTVAVSTERDTSVEVQYAVFEAGDLIASHKTDMTVNPQYPQELQPRDRTRVASLDQVNQIVARLNPERLGENPMASEGAPIVGPDGVVESGNARTIALQRAWQQGHENAIKYKNWLAENAERFGLDADAIQQMEAPILARIRQTDVDRLQFVEEANVPSVAAMSATEQALVDARRMTSATLQMFEPGETGQIDTAGNRPFIQRFFNEVVPAPERGRYMRGDGSLSQDGVLRIRNAIFARAYTDADFLGKLAEDTDPNIRNITNALLRVAPRIALMKDAIKRGELYDRDITQEIVAAANKLSHLRREGISVAEYLRQISPIDDTPALAKDILAVFEEYKRKPKVIADILSKYVDLVEALGAPDQIALIAMDTPEKEDLWDAAITKGRGEDVDQSSIFQVEPTPGEESRVPAGDEGAEPARSPAVVEGTERTAAPTEAAEPGAPGAPAAPGAAPAPRPEQAPADRGDMADAEPGRAGEVRGPEAPAPDDGVHIRGDGEGTAGARVVSARAEIKPPAVPDALAQYPDIAKNMMPHQVEGVNLALAALDTQGGFLLADGTGAGKTVQGLATAFALRRQGAKRVLILTERDAIIKDAWLADANEVFGPLAKEVRTWTPRAEGEGIFVSTYSKLRATKNRVPTTGWDAVILDESHNIKNWRESQQAIKGMELVENTPKVMFLSATPIDRPQDFRYFGERLGLFQGDAGFDKWVENLGVRPRLRTIRRGRSQVQIKEYVRKEGVDVGKVLEYIGNQMDDLTRKGLMIKREVPLDGLRVTVREVPVPEEYGDTVAAIMAAYGGAGARGAKRHQQIMAMRRHLENYKLRAAVDLARKELAKGRQVVIFTGAKDGATVRDMDTKQVLVVSEPVIGELREMLEQIVGPGNVAEIHGGLSGEAAPNIQAEMQAFQSGKKKVAIATDAMGSTGISLHDEHGIAPRTQIVVTLPWSATKYVQMLGRVHRLTSKSDTRAIILTTNTEIDQRLTSVVAGKLRMLRATVEGDLGRIDLERAAVLADVGEGMMRDSLDEPQFMALPAKAAGAEGAQEAISRAMSRAIQRLTPEAANQIRDIISKAMKVPIRARRPRVGGAMGEFSPITRSGRVMRRYASEWRVVGHELGHAFSSHTGFEAELNEAQALVLFFHTAPERITQGGEQFIRQEGTAEFFMLYFADPDILKLVAPRSLRRFEEILGKHPDLAEAVTMARGIAKNDLAGTPVQRALGSIATGGKRFQSEDAKRILDRWRGEAGWPEYEPTLPRLVEYLTVNYTAPTEDMWLGMKHRPDHILPPYKLQLIMSNAKEKAARAFENQPRDLEGRFVTGARPLRSILNDMIKLVAEAKGIEVPVTAPTEAKTFIEQVLDGYLVARRVVYLYEQGKGSPDGTGLTMTRKDAEAMVEWTERHVPGIRDLAIEFSRTLSDALMTLAVRYELITAKQRKQIEAKSDPNVYLPFYYVDEKKSIAEWMVGRPPDARTARQPVKRFYGQTRQVRGAVEATLMRFAEMYQAIEHKRLLNALEQIAREPGMGHFIEIERPPLHKARVRIRQVWEKMREFFEDIEEADFGRRAMELFAEGGLQQLRPREPVLMNWHAGKRRPVFMKVAPHIYDSVVYGIAPEKLPASVRLLGQVTQAVRMSALTSIRYYAASISRDIATGAIQTEAQRMQDFFKELGRGFSTAVGLDPELMDLYIFTGGYGGSMEAYMRALLRGDSVQALLPTDAPGWKMTPKGAWVRVARTPQEVLRVLEEFPRISEWLNVFKQEIEALGHDGEKTLQLIKKGRHRELPEEVQVRLERILVDAAHAAHENTVPFSMRGRSQVLRYVTRATPFLQGGIQGTYKFYRTVRDDPKRTGLRVLTLLFTMSLLSWLAMQTSTESQEFYRELDTAARARSWWIPIGDGKYLAIRKPYQYMLAAWLLENLLEWVFDNHPDRRKPLEDLRTAFGEAFGMNLVPPLMGVWIGLRYNTDSFGRPIESVSDQQLAKPLRHGPSTSVTARVLSEFISRFSDDPDFGLSPKQIDFIVDHLFSGIGRFGLSLSDKMLASITGIEPARRTAGIEYAPVIGGLIYGSLERGARSRDRFYTDYRRAQKLAASAAKWEREGRTPPRKPSDRDLALIRALPAMRVVADDIADMERQLREAKDLTPEQVRRARLFIDYVARVEIAYLYEGWPIPAPPKELGMAEADVLAILDGLEKRIYDATTRAAKREGGLEEAADIYEALFEDEESED